MTAMENGVSRWHRQLDLRWRALPARDRLALQVLLFFFAALALWWCAWQPLRAALQAARANVAAEQQLQNHLRSNAPRLAVRGHVATTLKPEELPALLAASAGKRGLEIAAFQQRADRRIALAINGPPQELLAWLEELRGLGVTMSELTTVREGDGNWRSDLVLAAASD